MKKILCPLCKGDHPKSLVTKDNLDSSDTFFCWQCKQYFNVPAKEKVQ